MACRVVPGSCTLCSLTLQIQLSLQGQSAPRHCLAGRVACLHKTCSPREKERCLPLHPGALFCAQQWPPCTRSCRMPKHTPFPMPAEPPAQHAPLMVLLNFRACETPQRLQKAQQSHEAVPAPVIRTLRPSRSGTMGMVPRPGTPKDCIFV